MNGGMSVLVVDDDPAAADLAATQLERLRDAIDVAVETGVDDALARFEADPAAFDCIVSDYNMPRMDGLELLTTVREISADVPFVLFTSKGSEEIASEAVSAGVTDYLQKGTGTERYELLANRVVNAVEAHRAEERADELARINEVISEVQRELVRESTREGIEERVCACLADSAPYTLAWIGEPDDGDRVAVRERAGTGTAYLDEISVRADDTPRGRGPVGRALRSEEVRATRNVADDEAFDPWSEVVERYGHAAVIALPLAYDDADYGVLALYSSRRYAFGEEERTALAELAGTIGQAIHAVETRAALERRERDLREERAVAEGTFDAIPDAIYAFDRDGRMLRWNDAFAATVGYDDETIAAMNALEFIPEADHDRIVERIEAVVERGETVTMESAFVTAEGETIPHEFNGTLLADGESTYGVIGSGRDIAERKRREEAVATLHESTRELVRQDDEAGVATATVEAAVEVLGFPVTAVRFHDPETDTLEPIAVSAGANRVLGERSTYDRGEGRPWRALESGEPVLADGSALAHNGNDLPLESALYVPLGDHGTLSIGSPDDGFDDVDVRLAAVLAANAAAALDRVGHESRLERYKRMLDAAGDGIYALDTDGRFTTVNDTLVAKTGYVREELLGEHVSTILGERDVEHGRTLIRDLLSRDSPGEVGDSFEATVHTAGGDTFPCEFRIALLPRVDDEFRGTVGVIRDVTERTERERELERYETMVETAPVGMFVLDAEGTIVGGNDRAASIVGHTMTDLSGEPFHILVEAGIVPEGAIEKHTQAVRELLSADGQASASYELTVSPPEGDRRTLRGHVSLLPRGDAFEGTIVVAEDITDRKRHERSIETLHTATRAMIDATDRDAIAETAVTTVERVFDMPVCGVWLHDESDGMLHPAAISDRGKELFGTAPTYAGGESLSWRAFEDGETRRYDRVDREADAHNPETPFRSEIVVPIGEYGVLNVGSTDPAAFDADDAALAKLLAANTEAALSSADRRRRLVNEHDRLAALFENVPDTAIRYDLVDGDPIVREVNTAFEEGFGYAADTVIGENIDEFIVPTEEETEADELNAQLLAGERIRTTVRRRTTGGVRDFLLRVVPVAVGEQNAEGYSIYTDITNQKRRERELERQNELLEEFAGVISHDLRNPLGVARGRLELAREDHPSEHHDAIEGALERMNDLIEDVLALARQGRVIGETEPVALAAIAERAWRTAGTETATLALGDLGEVAADPDRLARLFENLFRNAVEHVGEDVTVRVGPIETMHTNTRVSQVDQVNGFFVEDDGPGIADGEHGSVFESGYSTSEEGSGLGLSIVRSIAEAHGWTATVAERDAGGARFEIRARTPGEERS